MKSVDALRKLADGLSGIWIDPNDHSIIVTTCDDMPPSMDCVSLREHVNEILDGIDREVEERYMPLPLDADGVSIHVGDVLDPPSDCNDYVTLQVMRLMYDGYEQEWFFDGEAGGFCGLVGEHMDVAGWTHHHAPTVEDVLREFAEGLGVPVADSYIAASAAKLRLAEGVDE